MMIETSILKKSYIILLWKTQVNVNIFHHSKQKNICIKKNSNSRQFYDLFKNFHMQSKHLSTIIFPSPFLFQTL
jgi:hypothetical protein